ncbi:uncharacterized protein LAESUDRAFT_722937 [Laetiporus sulphureus 93-53]|uniref:Uncharacterized protein n=1 Tax=Laetiporus sulphureus 93-53 TaxID=1314785 RepID=A0A165FMW9_9APHY|nr:uncharacterized protein LAESUDRAFT_722937 [Laetiporus sulphureus 93-53]KZT09209.1 hypothetical protein LAESUDRAFT_722937 [Laetiporus sulphureus 93-53]
MFSNLIQLIPQPDDGQANKEALKSLAMRPLPLPGFKPSEAVQQRTALDIINQDVIGTTFDLVGERAFEYLLFGVLCVSGTIHFLTFNVEVSVSLRIPVIGDVQLGSASGNPKNEITLSVGSKAVASGAIMLHVKNGNEVWVRMIQLNTVVGSWNKEVKLFILAARVYALA